MNDFDIAYENYQKAKEFSDLAQDIEAKTLVILQNLCDHRNKTVKHCGDGGSYYDRAQYWDEFTCPDCGWKQIAYTGIGGYG